MLPITTKRLHLRSLRPEDAPVVANLVGNWNVVRWLARVPFPYALADAEAFIVDTLVADPRTSGTVAAITREGQLLGLISTDRRTHGVELGYWLGEPFWGNGTMSEAALAFVTALFAQSGIDALHAGYLEGNHASARILTKLGFEPAGRSVLFSHSNGREMPDFKLRLTRAQFTTLHPKSPDRRIPNR